jgi:hypothetical protein
MKPSPDYGWHCIGMGGNRRIDPINNVAKRLCEIGDNVDVFEALGSPQINLVLRVRNMLEIVLGVLVVIGVFVFWCDVTDSWNKVLNKTGKR